MKRKFTLWLSVWLSLGLTLAWSSEASVQVSSSLDGQKVVRLESNDLELIHRRHYSRSSRSRTPRASRNQSQIENFSPEVKRALLGAAIEFGVDGHRLNRIVACESGGNPNASNGSHHGLFQQSGKYWSGRVAEFNREVEYDVGGRIYDAEDNARVSAWMLSKPGGIKHWSCKG